jgi:hypothetical protein
MNCERPISSFDYSARSRREILRWRESDVPWDGLNEEGETEPEDSDDDTDDD